VPEEIYRARHQPGLFIVYAVSDRFDDIRHPDVLPGISYTQQYSPRRHHERMGLGNLLVVAPAKKLWSLVIPSSLEHQPRRPNLLLGEECLPKIIPEWLGTVALYLAIVGLFFYRQPQRKPGLWGGDYNSLSSTGWEGTTPFFRLMYAIVPMVKSMRGASMIMFLGSFSVALLPGWGYQSIFDWRDEGKKHIGNKATTFCSDSGVHIASRNLFSLAGQGMIKPLV